MSTAPSLTFRSLLDALLTRSGLSRPVTELTGPTGPVRALMVAALARRSGVDMVLHVVPADADIEDAVADIRFFLGALDSLADTAAEQQVLPLPSLQIDPYRGFLPHLKVASARARALHAMAGGTARVIVASSTALLPRVPDPVALFLASREIRPGVDLDPHHLAQALAAGGYEPQDPVDAHGEFCRRGGILDVFPPGEAMPVRIEFVGDTVESIRRFDAGTQRSVETLDQFVILPIREDGLATATDSAPSMDEAAATQPSTVFEYLRSRQTHIVVSEPEDVQKQIESAWEQTVASYAEWSTKPAGRLRRPPAELMLSWAEVSPELSSSVILKELEIGRAHV